MGKDTLAITVNRSVISCVPTIKYITWHLINKLEIFETDTASVPQILKKTFPLLI